MADVLVIEDEESLLHALRYNLARAGHEVRLCVDGLKGLEMVRENPPDLLVLDLMLPGLNGLEICRRVRHETGNPAVSHLPILVLRHPGQVLTRERLLRNVWGYEANSAETRTVDVHIRWLLGKLKTDPRAPQRIETVRGVGYMFTG